MRNLQQFLYKVYTAAYPATQRRKRRFTTAANMVFMAIVATAVFGIDTTKATVYQLFTMLCVLFAVAFLVGRFFNPRLTVSRQLPPFATAGEPLRYPVLIRNRSKKKMDHVSLREIPVIQYPTFNDFIHAREPNESKRNRWDRMVMYYRFQWLMTQHNLAIPKEHKLPAIGANSYLRTYVELAPRRRGYLELSGVAIQRLEPFGLFKSTVEIPVYNQLLVLPKRYPVPKINLPGHRKFHAGGIALASSIGNADEFRSLREYRPGDPMRMLHWKSVAKTGELIIRENDDEYFVRHALVLDTFTPHAHSSRFETAISIAASFVCTIRTQESMLDLMFVGDQAHCFSAGRGVDHTGKMLEILACITPCTDKSFGELFPLIRSHVSLLSGCICILQKWDDDRAELVHILMQNNIPVKVIVMVQGEETLPDTFVHLHAVDADQPEKGLAHL